MKYLHGQMSKFFFSQEKNEKDTILVYWKIVDDWKDLDGVFELEKSNGPIDFNTHQISNSLSLEEKNRFKAYFIIQLKEYSKKERDDYPRLYHLPSLNNNELITLYWHYFQATFQVECFLPPDNNLVLNVEDGRIRMIAIKDNIYYTTTFIKYPNDNQDESKVILYEYIIKDNKKTNCSQKSTKECTFQFQKELKFTFKDKDSPLLVVNSSIILNDTIHRFKINDLLYSLDDLTERSINDVESAFIEKIIFFDEEQKNRFEVINQKKISSILIENLLIIMNEKILIDLIHFYLCENSGPLCIYKLNYLIKTLNINADKLSFN